MRKTLLAGILVLAAIAGFAVSPPAVCAQTATKTTTPPPPPKPTLAQLGIVIYPAKGQTPEQQKNDEDACYAWAEAQTGVQLTTQPVDTQAAGEAAKQQTADATQGAAVAGAARGAAGGAIIGAIAGDARTGAAIGAAAGAMGGRRAKKNAEAQAQQKGEQQAQQQNQALVDQFKKAACTCLEGRGYTAK